MTSRAGRPGVVVGESCSTHFCKNIFGQLFMKCYEWMKNLDPAVVAKWYSRLGGCLMGMFWGKEETRTLGVVGYGLWGGER